MYMFCVRMRTVHSDLKIINELKTGFMEQKLRGKSKPFQEKCCAAYTIVAKISSYVRCVCVDFEKNDPRKNKKKK